MSQQSITNGGSRVSPPWSPAVIAVSALLFPIGAALLTVRNLRRLDELDAASARRHLAGVFAVSVFGLVVLLLTAPRSTQGVPQISSDSVTVLTFGIALASYLVQRPAFNRWRAAHTRSRTGSWLSALGGSLLANLAGLAAAVIMSGILLVVMQTGVL